MKRVVVTGGRKYSDWEKLSATLDALQPDIVFVGDATGADSLAYEWGVDRGVPVRVFEANWSEFGLKAGPMRNVDMLESAIKDDGYNDSIIVLAFPGGKGTNSCVKSALDRNLVVLRVQE